MEHAQEVEKGSYAGQHARLRAAADSHFVYVVQKVSYIIAGYTCQFQAFCFQMCEQVLHIGSVRG